MLKLLKDVTKEELQRICDRHNKDCRRCPLRLSVKQGYFTETDCKRNGNHIKEHPTEIIDIEE